MTYQIWDDETGNRVASLASEVEAVDFLRGMFAANGADGVRELAIVAYPDDGSDPITVLEGTEFLAQVTIPA